MATRPLEPARSETAISSSAEDGTGDRSRNLVVTTSALASNASTHDSTLNFWLSEEKQLEPGHRTVFLQRGNAAAYEDYVIGLRNAIQRTVDSSRVAKLSRKIKPIFVLANSIAPITASAGQVSPMPASLILGGITCILSFSARVDDYQTKLIEMLEWMGDEISLINRYREHSLFDNNLQLELELCENRIAADVLKFCSRVARMFYDRDGKEKSGVVFALKAQCKDFDARFGDIRTHFKLHVDALKNCRDLANTQRAKRIHDGVNDIQILLDRESSYKQEILKLEEKHNLQRENEERRRRLLNLIPSIDFGEIHENNFERRVPGSGDWLLQQDVFRNWRASITSALLWIRGKPGSGKSHLASRVISELGSESTEHQTFPMAYAYCTSTQSKKRMTLNNLLGSLLGQLYKYLSLTDGIESLLCKADAGNKEELSRSEMKEGIKAVVALQKSTFIIIDGLDECSHFPDKQFEDFCRFLVELASPTTTNVSIKLLVLSRPDYSAIDKALSGFPTIQLDHGANDQDIIMYISSMVDEINPDPSPEVRDGFQDIKTIMFNHAGGLFLWVHFKAKQFKEIGAVEDIKEALQETSEGLDDLYGEEMRKILSRTFVVRKRALRALLWVTNSYCALSKEELLEALVIKPGMKSLNQGQRLPRDFSLSTECADLINEDHGFYRLRHASLRDFLHSELPGLEMYSCLQREAHSTLAETCLTYMNLDQLGSISADSVDELRALQREYPLLHYAASFWGQHLAKISRLERQKLEILVMKVLQNESALRLCIQTLQIEDFKHGLHQEGSPTALHILAVFNLSETAKAMSDLKSYMCRKDAFGRLPIEYAVLYSSTEMMVWMLETYRDMTISSEPFDMSSLQSVKSALFHNAAERDLVQALQLLVNLGLDQNTSVVAGRTPLHKTILARSTQSANCLLDLGAFADTVADNYDTPLIAAARTRNASLVRSLLRHKIDINHRGEHEETALHWAVKHDLQGMALDLLAHGADVNARMSPKPNFWGHMPLHDAIAIRSATMVKTLIEHGANVDARFSTSIEWAEETPMHLAIRFGSVEILEILIKEKADLEARSSNGDTPLLMACQLGQLRGVEVLYKSGANIAASQIATGCNALHLAARSGQCSLIELITTAAGTRLTVDSTNLRGETPLHLAIRAGQVLAARKLLDIGAAVDVASSEGSTPLHLAISLNRPDIAKMILELEACNMSFMYADKDKRTPLHFVSLHGIADLFPFVSQTAVEHLFDSKGFSPLHYAAEWGHTDIMSLLLTTFPVLKFNESGFNGLTPLHMAAIRGSLSAVEFLTKIEPSSRSFKDHESRLPLHYAADAGHLSCFLQLLTPDTMESCDNNGASVLWLASKNGHQAVVEHLVAQGADINKSDIHGISPALISLYMRHENVTSFLLDSNADPGISSLTGLTLLRRAARRGHQQIVRRLLSLDLNTLSVTGKLEQAFIDSLISGRSDVVELFLQEHVMNAIDKSRLGRNPVHLAVQFTTPQMLKLIASKFPDEIHDIDKDGKDSMCYAAVMGRADMIDSLCEIGLSIYGSSGLKMSPLEIASVWGYEEFARKLLARGVQNEKTESAQWRLWKRDPLHLAVIFRRPKTAKLLLENGEDPTRKDWLGLSSLHYAQRNPLLLEVFHAWLSPERCSLTNTPTTMKDVQGAIAKVLSTSELAVDAIAQDPTLRCAQLDHIAEALMLIGTEISISKARLCCIELTTHYWQRSCDFCNRNCTNKAYRCTVCENMDLCQTCYRDYRSSQSPEIPSHIKVLKKLEQDASAVLEVLEVFKWRDVRELSRCLTAIGKLVNAWTEIRSTAYSRWAQRSKSQTVWTPRNVPSWALVELIAKLFSGLIDFKTGYLRDEAQSVYVRQEIDWIYDNYNPRAETSILLCEGHQYCPITTPNELDAEDREQFDSDGKLRKEFFHDLLNEGITLPTKLKMSFENKQDNVEDKQDTLEAFDNLHPKSNIPGRNEERVKHIGSQLRRDISGLIERRDTLIAQNSDSREFDETIETYEIAWRLAHAMLGVRFAEPLIVPDAPRSHPKR